MEAGHDDSDIHPDLPRTIRSSLEQQQYFQRTPSLLNVSSLFPKDEWCGEGGNGDLPSFDIKEEDCGDESNEEILEWDVCPCCLSHSPKMSMPGGEMSDRNTPKNGL